ncbi:MAG: tetratricopeptide repeat protein [Candidatus Omnitrophota bacterium]|nr:MAG: tetratricopeptide repeat protein [Candidatus Omnitrophota bacterium]
MVERLKKSGGRIQKVEKIKEDSREQEKPLSSVGLKVRSGIYATLATTERLIDELTGLYRKIFMTDDNKKADFYKEEGLNFFDKGDYQKAVKFFLTYIQNGGAQDIDVLLNLGLAYSSLDENMEALKYFKKAEELDRDDPDIISELASCFVRTEQYPQAIECLKRAINIEPKFANNYYLLGTSYERTNQLKEAREMYKKAIELSPREAIFYQALGFAHEYSGNHKDAIVCFKKAMELEKHR